MLGHKTSLNKFNKLEIIAIIFSDYDGMKLEINPPPKKTGKFTNMCTLNDMLLKNQWVNEEKSKGKPKNDLR